MSYLIDTPYRLSIWAITLTVVFALSPSANAQSLEACPKLINQWAGKTLAPNEWVQVSECRKACAAFAFRMGNKPQGLWTPNEGRQYRECDHANVTYDILNRKISPAASVATNKDISFYKIGDAASFASAYFEGHVLGDLEAIQSVLHLSDLIKNPQKLQKGVVLTPYRFVDGTWAEPSQGYALVKTVDGTYGLIATSSLGEPHRQP